MERVWRWHYRASKVEQLLDELIGCWLDTHYEGSDNNSDNYYASNIDNSNSSYNSSSYSNSSYNNNNNS